MIRFIKEYGVLAFYIFVVAISVFNLINNLTK